MICQADRKRCLSLMPRAIRIDSEPAGRSIMEMRFRRRTGIRLFDFLALVMLWLSIAENCRVDYRNSGSDRSRERSYGYEAFRMEPVLPVFRQRVRYGLADRHRTGNVHRRTDRPLGRSDSAASGAREPGLCGGSESAPPFENAKARSPGFRRHTVRADLKKSKSLNWSPKGPQASQRKGTARIRRAFP